MLAADACVRTRRQFTSAFWCVVMNLDYNTTALRFNCSVMEKANAEKTRIAYICLSHKPEPFVLFFFFLLIASRSIFSVLNFSFWYFIFVNCFNKQHAEVERRREKKWTKCAREHNALRSVTEILPISWHCWLRCAGLQHEHDYEDSDIDCVGHENARPAGTGARRNCVHCGSASELCARNMH